MRRLTGHRVAEPVRADGVVLAYEYRAGRGPTIVFLPGYMSDMQGTKALALEAWAQANGRAMLRLDYSGCGASGGRFEDATLDIWRDDACAVIDAVTEGPVLLVGSSMGGWLMLLIALALGDRVAALVGIAAAPDFTEWAYSSAEQAEFAAGRSVIWPSVYGAPLVMTAAFWRSARALAGGDTEIAIGCPVRLLHGQCDAEVPWELALRLAARLRSDDVQVTLVKDGDHRLSRPQDIALLIARVDELLEAR